MIYSRPLALVIVLALVAASAGCGRPAVAVPGADALAAAESDPAPHTAPDGAAGDQKDGENPPFQFPKDAGGVLLAKVLSPANEQGPLNDPNPVPRRHTPAPALDSPTLSLPLPVGQAAPPPVPGEHTRKSPAPHLMVEETLGLGRGDPEPPQPRSFFVGERVRVPSVDVNEPIPLPILAQPTPDRASLDDPTTDESTAAALEAAMPQRIKPFPYFRLTLPDPFDNRRPLTLAAPAEDDSPRTGTVHPPKP